MKCEQLVLPVSLLEAIDERVDALLAEQGVSGPPVSAVALAGALGIVVAGGPGRRRRSYPPADLAADNVEDRLLGERQAAWAVGKHELAAVAARMGIEPAELTLAGAERIASTFASRLLMPGQWFDLDAKQLGRDVIELQRRYSTASVEAVGWRLLHLPEPTIVSLFDNGHVVQRRSNAPVPSAELLDAERAAQAYAHRYSLPAAESRPGAFARAWPLHSPDWRREIVVTLIDAAEQLGL